MEEFTQVNGTSTQCLAMESLNGRTGKDTLVII